MKVYEMVFSTRIEDRETLLFLKNTAENRMNFLCKIKGKIISELENCKKNQKNRDIINFFDEIYWETYSNIEKMQDEFITNGSAKIDNYTFMTIKEEIVI